MASTEPVTLDFLAKELKSLRKEVRKIRQTLEDPTGEKAAERAKNNGLNKPQDVTPALRAFLNLAADEKISRSQVTKRINQYVTEKGLKAGQQINLDAALKALLAPPEDVKVTFLNIQRYINPHYIKEPKEPKPKAAAEPKEDKPKAARPKVAKA
jgi:upstream activation factor subunit UAF30